MQNALFTDIDGDIVCVNPVNVVMVAPCISSNLKGASQIYFVQQPGIDHSLAVKGSVIETKKKLDDALVG